MEPAHRGNYSCGSQDHKRSPSWMREILLEKQQGGKKKSLAHSSPAVRSIPLARILLKPACVKYQAKQIHMEMEGGQKKKEEEEKSPTSSLVSSSKTVVVAVLLSLAVAADAGGDMMLRRLLMAGRGGGGGGGGRGRGRGCSEEGGRFFFLLPLLRSVPQARRAATLSDMACVSISGCSTLRGARGDSH